MNTPRKKLFIYICLTLVLIGTVVEIHLLNKSDRYLAKDQFILPGTGTIDFDDIRFGGNEDFYRKRLLASDINVDYSELKFDADDNCTDIFWSYRTSSQRSLVPSNGTELAVLEFEKDFNDITLKDLTSSTTLAHYSSNEIIADDDQLNPGNSLLKQGTIIGVKTSSGNFGKMRIDGYLNLKRRRWRYIPGIHTERQNYNLLVSLVVYKSQ
jgi:hypothetical protein